MDSPGQFPADGGCTTDRHAGSGRDKRQKQIVQGRITDGTLFPNMSLAISDNISGAVVEMEKRLRAMVRQSMVAIQNDFDLTIAPLPNDSVHLGSHPVEERTVHMKERQALADQAQSFKKLHADLLESIASVQ